MVDHKRSPPSLLIRAGLLDFRPGTSKRRYLLSITIYNTLRREKEVFEPLDPSRVTMYVCGPTVYNYAHIGNARPAVIFDVLHRLLKSRGA